MRCKRQARCSHDAQFLPAPFLSRSMAEHCKRWFKEVQHLRMFFK